jgi:uncharacterized protein (UPF0332 family)
VKGKTVDRKFGEIIRDAFDRRTAGDYDDWVTFSKEEVTSLFEGMKEFIHTVDDLL